MKVLTRSFLSAIGTIRVQAEDWNPLLVWIHNIADALIWLAFLAIPALLVNFILRRGRVSFSRLYWMFGAFIVCCGFAHFMEIISSHWPTYWLSAAIKIVTALVSWATVFTLAPAIPKALSNLRGRDLMIKEIEERKHAEQKLAQVHSELEARVQERTADLSKANDALRTENEDRKRAEEAVRRLAAIVESSEDAIIGFTLEGTITSWNSGAERIFGYSAAEIIGKPHSTLVPADRRHHTEEIWSRIQRGEHLKPVETVRIRKDGRIIDVWVSVSPVRDDTGQLIGVSAIDREISDRKQMEKELRQAKKAAEAANQAKSEFLANVSHEMRTPLSAIVGMTDLTLKTPLTDKQREYLQVVGESSASLLAVIEDILDFSKIEAGKLDFHPAPFPLRKRVESALKVLRTRAQTKGLDLVCDVHPDVPDGLVGDENRLRQVLVNLVANAVKFTARGGVVVRIEKARASDGEVCLHFCVVDTGIGIPADKLTTIFLPFEQADNSTTRRYGGTGLGLTICNRLVEMMGGRMWVESDVGQGSTFHFTARFQPAGDAQPLRYSAAVEIAARDGTSEAYHETTRPGECSAQKAARSLRVLLAEDNPANQKLMVSLLEERGHSVVVVNTGMEALSVLKSKAFDVAVMDIQMPEMSGFEAVAQIREKEKTTGEHLPIIALTAHAMRGDRERFLEAGMDGYLAKPVDFGEFLGAVEGRPTAPVNAAGLFDPTRPEAPVMDRASVLERMRGREGALKKALQAFMDNCPKLMGQMQQAVVQQDAYQLGFSAHALRGSVSFFGGVAAGQLAEKLEEMGKTSRLEEAAETYQDLEKAVNALTSTLQEFMSELGSAS
jgi:PAS domain S-box-containing protein